MPGLPPQVRVPEGLAPGQSLIVRLPDHVSARDTSSRVALCARPHRAALTATGIRGCPGLCSMLVYGGSRPHVVADYGGSRPHVVAD